MLALLAIFLFGYALWAIIGIENAISFQRGTIRWLSGSAAWAGVFLIGPHL